MVFHSKLLEAILFEAILFEVLPVEVFPPLQKISFAIQNTRYRKNKCAKAFFCTIKIKFIR